MMLNAADIALLETWATDPTTAFVGHLSWVAVVILLSAMIVPSTPRKMLLAGLASASFGPIGVWLAHLRGVDTPSPLLTILMYFPAYSCAVAAVVPARMFQKFGRRLREARDLGSYELVERLGEGGMGEVWRARHRLLARPAAIKLVRPAMLGAGDEAATRLARRRFESEAQATAALTSPHTIRLFDFGAADDGRFYYVMELLEGRDMATLVQETGPMPVARVRVPAQADLPFAGRSPRARAGPSRHQAGEHLRLPDGPRPRRGQGARLRAGPAGPSRRRRRT